MPTYPTIDYLPDLSSSAMNSAGRLTFSPYTPTYSSITWDNSASFSSSASYALLYDTFVWTGKAGATYDIFSSSYFDPYLIQVYDSLGNVIAVDSESYSDTYGYDYVWDFVAPYTGTYYVSAGWHQGSASSNKFVWLSIYEDVDTAAPKVNYITGSSYRDRLTATDANDVIDGGGDIDFVTYSGSRNNYTITKTGGTVTVVAKTGAGGTDTVTNVERLIFSDMRVSLEVSGIDAQVYRMYQAAFDRKPDLPGLGYWFLEMDKGLNLTGLANHFISSPEFSSKYGLLNNSQFVNQLYQNVLHRTADSGGLAYHVSNLDAGMSRAQVLVGFSESPENQAALVGVIQNGIEYQV